MLTSSKFVVVRLNEITADSGFFNDFFFKIQSKTVTLPILNNMFT